MIVDVIGEPRRCNTNTTVLVKCLQAIIKCSHDGSEIVPWLFLPIILLIRGI